MDQGVKKKKPIMKNQRKVIISEKLPPLQVPYSHGVKVGGWVFTAGIIGMDTGGTLNYLCNSPNKNYSRYSTTSPGSTRSPHDIIPAQIA